MKRGSVLLYERGGDIAKRLAMNHSAIESAQDPE
jgi:hypothetical protein